MLNKINVVLLFHKFGSNLKNRRNFRGEKKIKAKSIKKEKCTILLHTLCVLYLF